jgi:hypothetical protein
MKIIGSTSRSDHGKAVHMYQKYIRTLKFDNTMHPQKATFKNLKSFT